MANLTILAPREVGNTDGLDPHSRQNILMDTCYIDVGDDGISSKVSMYNGEKRNFERRILYRIVASVIIQSSNHSGKMIPTRNVIMLNLAIKSYNWCIGSATFGGIYYLLFEDSTIGELQTVSLLFCLIISRLQFS